MRIEKKTQRVHLNLRTILVHLSHSMSNGGPSFLFNQLSYSLIDILFEVSYKST